MSPEDAILISLYEARTYNKLYLESSKVKKTVNEALPKSTFADAMKKLQLDHYIVFEKVGKQKKKYLLNPKKSEFVRLEPLKKYAIN